MEKSFKTIQDCPLQKNLFQADFKSILISYSQLYPTPYFDWRFTDCTGYQEI